MMFWPSMMSLEPPPVTPSRKFPPRLGVPAAAVDDELVLDEEEPEPHAAARPPTAASPAAPARSCRRETSVMSWPFCSPALDPRGRSAFLPMRVPGDVRLAAESAGTAPRAGMKPRRAGACMAAPELRIAR